jgi:hypothetical protein
VLRHHAVNIFGLTPGDFMTVGMSPGPAKWFKRVLVALASQEP